MYDTIEGACTDAPPLMPMQAKEILRAALVVVRHSKQVQPDLDKVAELWRPRRLQIILEKIPNSERLKLAKSVSAHVRQMMAAIQPDLNDKSKKRKRKSKGEEDEGKKGKRKKLKKGKE